MPDELLRLEDDACYLAWFESQAYVSVAMSIYGDKKEVESNFIHAYFQRYPLSMLSLDEKMIYCYREAISLYPQNSNALFGLAACLSKGAEVDVEDLGGTRFEGQRLENIKLNDLLAELYRKVLVYDRRNSKAIRNLAFCLQQGAHIYPEDLKRTKFESAKIVDRKLLIIELYTKVIAMNPNDRMAFYFLQKIHSKEEGVVRAKTYYPQYTYYCQSTKLEESLGPQKRAISPPKAR